MKIYLIFITLVCVSLETKLPSNFQVCNRNDPNLNRCLELAIADALPKLKNGIPELNVPPLEPLYVPSVTIEGDSKGAINLVQNYKNYKIYGLIDHKIEKMNSSISRTELKIDVELSVTESRTEADYDFNGRILMLPVVGSGKCNITLVNERTKISIFADTFKRKGTTYLQVNKFSVMLNPGKVVFNFDNLFNGNKRLGTEINKVLNDSWKDVFKDGKHGNEEMLETVLKDYVNKIFIQIPYDEMFLA